MSKKVARTVPVLSVEAIGRYYFPVNLSQFEDLVGKVLTQIEAMNLRESVEKANKDLARQTLWKWFDGVQENSLTSFKGCIAPILAPNESGVAKPGQEYIWLTQPETKFVPEE